MKKGEIIENGNTNLKNLVVDNKKPLDNNLIFEHLKVKKMKWFSRQLVNEQAVLIWLNVLDKDMKVTPDRIKVVGFTVYFYNDKEV